MNLIWSDANIDKFSIDYDSVEIKLEETTGREITILCKGYIGFSINGFWDDSIVESSELFTNHDYITMCQNNIKNAYGKKPNPSGCPDRNEMKHRMLEIRLIDGLFIWVVANEFVVSSSDS